MTTNYLLPTLSQILIPAQENVFPSSPPSITPPSDDFGSSFSKNSPTLRRAYEVKTRRLKAEREWCGAIAALNYLLTQVLSSDSPTFNGGLSIQGFILSAPAPILAQPGLVASLPAWIFTTRPQPNFAYLSCHGGWENPSRLLPASLDPKIKDHENNNQTSALLLSPEDPLATEQFCLIFTAQFSLVMVLGEDSTSTPAFHFSFAPEIVTLAWLSLRARILVNTHQQISHLDSLFAQFPPGIPDYKLVMQFSQLLLKYLPEQSGEGHHKLSENINNKPFNSYAQTKIPHPINANNSSPIPKRDDIELLQAIAHEVRTPLATIRTLTRLLLKRRHLEPDIINRLEMIDRECTEQIDRFGLIFRAVELETSTSTRSLMHLTATSLTKVFTESIPRWQKQASRRNVTLDISLPQKMPAVVSDPTLLDQVLTGLLENFTSRLTPGSHVQVKVMLAGSQLKLQLQSQNDPNVAIKSPISTCKNPASNRPYPIGNLLMFQPETGNLSLNLNVTKNLFQALGGKLIVRQNSQKGEVLTIFLPLTEF